MTDTTPDPDRKVYRDAVTGEYVTEEYAAEHPDTTVSETVVPHTGYANGDLNISAP